MLLTSSTSSTKLSTSSLLLLSLSSSELSYKNRFVMSMSLIFVAFIILSLVTAEVALGAELPKEHVIKTTVSSSPPKTSTPSPSSPSRAKRQVRSAGVRNYDPTAEQLDEMIDQVENLSLNDNLLHYTPTTPSPNEVNCHLEIPVTRVIGGRCVNLGSFIGCQAGIHLAFDSMCEQRFGRTVQELLPNPFTNMRRSSLFRSRQRQRP